MLLTSLNMGLYQINRTINAVRNDLDTRSRRIFSSYIQIRFPCGIGSQHLEMKMTNQNSSTEDASNLDEQMPKIKIFYGLLFLS